MIVNRAGLLEACPIKDMLEHTNYAHGTSYGLSELGYDIRCSTDIILTPQERFCLSSSIEQFTMPNHLCGRVCDKSTWARRGVSVFNTLIKPGWNGYLTLELALHSNETVKIPQGSGIAQIIFETLLFPTQYTGLYQNQDKLPVGSQEYIQNHTVPLASNLEQTLFGD